ncbi:MAG: hypothetical protein HeimC3_47160 [Candidatus Heimdallarchaeota archaeon LC_3]|nr:MAG: hypothetical protein HeimC3_47160 [Candidatus Heimdallarchaeota archaeon LC_3]
MSQITREIINLRLDDLEKYEKNNERLVQILGVCEDRKILKNQKNKLKIKLWKI